MMSLFTSFDFFFFYKGVIFYFLFFNLIFLSFYYFSFWKFIFLKKFLFFYDLFNITKEKSINKLMYLILLSIFFLIFLINFFSIYMYWFPLSAQISMVFVFSFSTWLTLIFFSMMNSKNYFLTHLCPVGSPLILTPFLILIECISNTIRPLTLMIRLVANITSGHLLMILLSKMVFIFPLSFFFCLGLHLIENFVSFIQAYIFFTLISLYYSEVK